MTATEKRWARAIGIKKTDLRIKVGNREQFVYSDKCGGLYAIVDGLYRPVYHSMCYLKEDGR